jgi:hypothetical protein
MGVAVLAENYVVRIYRRGDLAGSSVVGVVEVMPTGWQKPFRSLEELMGILARPDPGSDIPTGHDADDDGEGS